MLRDCIHCALLLTGYWSAQLIAKEAAHILPQLEPGDLCIEIGAHCGSWTLALARRVTSGQVFAIEALSYYARLIRWLVRLLRFRNVHVLNYGATLEAQSLQLIWKDTDGHRLTSYTHLAGRGNGLAATITIFGRPLADLIPTEFWPRVKFIRCDVEGAELEALEGARAILAQARPIVFSAINSEYCRRYGLETAEVFALFDGLDYSPFVLNEKEVLVAADATTYAGVEEVWFYPGSR